MADRITLKRLRSLVSQINEQLGLPNEPYQIITVDGEPTAYMRDPATGRLKPNTGTYILEINDAGKKLTRMCVSGGETDVFYSRSNRDLANQLSAFLEGIRIERINANNWMKG